jgi:hypothetical protein
MQRMEAFSAAAANGRRCRKEDKENAMANAPIPIKFQIFKGDQLVREETLNEPVIKIGKLASSHLRLEDETVSRMHAVVEVTGPGEIQLIDLGSTRGTTVNGERINKAILKVRRPGSIRRYPRGCHLRCRVASDATLRRCRLLFNRRDLSAVPGDHSVRPAPQQYIQQAQQRRVRPADASQWLRRQQFAPPTVRPSNSSLPPQQQFAP